MNYEHAASSISWSQKVLWEDSQTNNDVTTLFSWIFYLISYTCCMIIAVMKGMKRWIAADLSARKKQPMKEEEDMMIC